MLTYDGAKIIKQKSVRCRVFAVGKEGIFIAKYVEADQMIVFHIDDVSAKDRPLVIEGAWLDVVNTKVEQHDGRIERRSELVFNRAEPPKEEGK